MVKLNKKNKSKLSIDETKQSERYHELLTFNFSYISSEKHFNFEHCEKGHKSALLNSIIRLSSMTKIEVLALNKDRGLENLDDGEVSFRINNSFAISRLKNCEKGYWIFRFNGKNSRCIGKIIDNVFYVLCIDTHLKAYNHGS